MNRETYLVRLGPPSNGDTIHTSDCRYSRAHSNPLRWAWADRIGFDNIDWDALRHLRSGRCAVVAPQIASLLKRGVVQLAGFAELFLKRFDLTPIRVQPVSIGTPHSVPILFAKAVEPRPNTRGGG